MSNQKKTFLVFLILTTLLFFWLIKDFFATLTLAGIIVVLFNPIYKAILFRTKGNRSVSSILAIVIMLFTFLIPSILLASLIYWQVNILAHDLKNLGEHSLEFNQAMEDIIKQINFTLERNNINYQITREQLSIWYSSLGREVGLNIISWVGSLGANLPNFLTHLILMLIFIHFFFVHQRDISRAFHKISPFPDEVTTLYVSKALAMSRSMIKGTFVIAFVQGFLATLALIITGVPYAFFWFLVLTIAAIIPFIGVGVILVPIAVFVALSGNVIGGIFILLFQLLVVSNIDNILRPKLVEKDVELPEAITLLGVIAGLYVFGPIGLIFGPVITVIVSTTYEIYVKYYSFSVKSFLVRDK